MNESLFERYENRTEAGEKLASAVAELNPESPYLLALPRGGVPVALKVAEKLDAPMDVMVVRKIGYPGDREIAIGAINPAGAVFNEEIIVHEKALEKVLLEEAEELKRRLKMYRGKTTYDGVDWPKRTVIMVDDGIATGWTMEAACDYVHKILEVAKDRIIVAVPVGAKYTCERLRKEGYTVIVPKEIFAFQSVGDYYVEFKQVEDWEVLEMLGSG